MCLGIIGGVSFGTAAIFIRLITLNAIAITAWRLIIGGSVISLLMIRKPLADENVNYKAIFLLGTILFIHFIFFIKSVQDTFILNATMLVNTAPLLSLIIVALLRLEKIDLLDTLAVILSVIGILVMFNCAFRINTETFLGDIEALLAALAISIYAVSGRILLRGKINPIKLSGIVYLLAGVEAIIFSYVVNVNLTPSEVGEIVFLIALGLIPTAIGHTLFLYSLKGLKPHEIQILALLEPIVATILGVLIFMEIPPSTSLIGSIIIATTIILISIRKPLKETE